MKEAINTTLVMFVCMVIGAALGACIMYSNMNTKEETPNGSNVPDEFLVTENDVPKPLFGKYWYIINLFVHPKFRRMGIAYPRFRRKH